MITSHRDREEALEDCQESWRQKRAHVWYLQWNQRGCGKAHGKKAWEREDSGDDPGGHSREIFLYTAF